MQASSIVGAMIAIFMNPWVRVDPTDGHDLYIVIPALTLGGLVILISAPKPLMDVSDSRVGRGKGQEIPI
jgi:hypothetical protein